MSVASASEIHTGRAGSDESKTVSATRAFRVITTSASDDQETVLAAVPQRGAAHPSNPWLYVKSRRATNESFSKKVWNVTVEYESGTGENVNPLYETPIITWNTDTVTEMVTKDKDDHAILNSAGDYFLEGIAEDVAYWTANISKKLSAVPTWLLTYRNAVNSDAFTIDGLSVAAYQAKMAGMRIGWWEQKNDTWYRQLDLTIRFSTTWVRSVLDQGLYQIVSSDHVPCKDDQGAKAIVPMLLNGSGVQIAAPTPSTAAYMTFHTRPEQPFQTILYFLYESY